MPENIIDKSVNQRAVNLKVAKLCGLPIHKWGRGGDVPPFPYIHVSRDDYLLLWTGNVDAELTRTGKPIYWNPAKDMNLVRDWLWPAMLERGWGWHVLRPSLGKSPEDSFVDVWWLQNCFKFAERRVRLTDIAHTICVTACEAVYGEDWDKPKPEGSLLELLQAMASTGNPATEYYQVSTGGGCSRCTSPENIALARRRGWIEDMGTNGKRHELTDAGRKVLENRNDG